MTLMITCGAREGRIFFLSQNLYCPLLSEFVTGENHNFLFVRSRLIVECEDWFVNVSQAITTGRQALSEDKAINLYVKDFQRRTL